MPPVPTAPNPTSYALLGLLSVRSWSTYELAQQVHRSLRWFWPRAVRRLYDEPKRLEAAGLVDVEERFVGRRRSRVYSINDAGREALSTWLDQPAAPRVTEFEGMVKVFFAEAGDRDQLLTTLRSVEQDACERVAELHELSGRPTNFPHRRHLHALCLRAMLDDVEATLRWARWAQEQVALWPSSTEAGDWDPHAEMARVAARAAALLGRDVETTGDGPD